MCMTSWWDVGTMLWHYLQFSLDTPLWETSSLAVEHSKDYSWRDTTVSLNADLERSVLGHAECPVYLLSQCGAAHITAREAVSNHSEAVSTLLYGGWWLFLITDWMHRHRVLNACRTQKEPPSFLSQRVEVARGSAWVGLCPVAFLMNLSLPGDESSFVSSSMLGTVSHEAFLDRRNGDNRRSPKHALASQSNSWIFPYSICFYQAKMENWKENNNNRPPCLLKSEG